MDDEIHTWMCSHRRRGQLEGGLIFYN